MKLVLISDTHNRHKHLTSKGTNYFLPPGDLLIHAGDFSGVGGRDEVESFLEWCIKFANNYTYGIVFIAGNHDRSFDPKFNRYEDDTEGVKPVWLQKELLNLPSNVIYLENNSVNVGGVNIWGSPITPWFHGDRWAFNKHRGAEIWEVWDQIPQETDIVVTHGPVSYKLDYIPRTQEYVGCDQLRTAVQKVKPLIHVSGHIHESYGYDYDADTHYFNASTCDEFYYPSNKPWEVEADWSNREINIL